MNEADAVDRFVSAMGRVSALADFQERGRRIREMQTPKCGSCSHWMKSRSCPREVPTVRGRNTGPSCEDRPCSKYEIDPLDAKMHREAWERLTADMTAAGFGDALPTPPTGETT
jgi:hypothetical protein